MLHVETSGGWPCTPARAPHAWPGPRSALADTSKVGRAPRPQRHRPATGKHSQSGRKASPGTSVPPSSQGALTATFSVLMHILAPFPPPRSPGAAPVDLVSGTSAPSHCCQAQPADSSLLGPFFPSCTLVTSCSASLSCYLPCYLLCSLTAHIQACK